MGSQCIAGNIPWPWFGSSMFKPGRFHIATPEAVRVLSFQANTILVKGIWSTARLSYKFPCSAAVGRASGQTNCSLFDGRGWQPALWFG